MSKGRQTRDSILHHAATVASVHGLEALSIGRLAELTGLSKSGLFGHFGSKEALQQAVLESVVDDFRAAVVVPALRETRGSARLERLFEGWLAWALADRAGGCPLLGASTELDDRPGRLREYLVDRQRAWLDCVAGAASKAVAEGDFREDLDVVQFAFEFNGIGLAFNFSHRLLGDPRAAGRADSAFRALVAGATR
ncbi:MAG TPA: TetR/AcrR family transcriptional regulator [Gammaproteobacteria bacterium]|nr:TetR/AcrR family transcriptional regulator [Gammaproteobacteria bacterium]